MYACLYVCTYAYMYVRPKCGVELGCSRDVDVCVHACLHKYILHTHVHTHMHTPNIRTYVHIDMSKIRTHTYYIRVYKPGGTHNRVPKPEISVGAANRVSTYPHVTCVYVCIYTFNFFIGQACTMPYGFDFAYMCVCASLCVCVYACI